MTLSVIDPINLRYRDVIAAKKNTCETMPTNSVTANKIARVTASRGPAAVLFCLDWKRITRWLVCVQFRSVDRKRRAGGLFWAELLRQSVLCMFFSDFCLSKK
jgi:hypothetical protein